MNILLMTARVNTEELSGTLADHMPLGLGYLAATLKKYSKHQPFIIDVSHTAITDDDLIIFIEKNKIDIVGISAVIANYKFCQSFTQRLRRDCPKVLIVIGGALPSTLPHIVSEDCEVDFVVRGPGEMVLLDIADGRLKPLGAPSVVEGWFPASLEEIPWPDRELLGHHSYPCLPPWSDFPLISSRGCPFHCNYCYKVNGSAYKERSVDDLFAELCYVVEALCVSHFMMQDDLFFLNPARVQDLCGRIIKHALKIRWSAVSRVDLLDEKTVFALKDAGCYAVAVGVESGSEKMLHLMNKQLSIKKTEYGLALLRKYGIRIMPYVIVGYPGETVDTLKETEKFLIRNHIYSGMTYAFPMPGTRLWDIAVAKEMIPNIRAYLNRASFDVSAMHFNFTEMPDAELRARVTSLRNVVLDAYLGRILSGYDLASGRSHIFIYGYGNLGRGALAWLQKSNISLERIRGFIDDDPSRVQSVFCGIPVRSLEESHVQQDDICLIANSFLPEVMVEKLQHRFPLVKAIVLA